MGDALTLKKLDDNSSLIFSEWSLINDKVKRRDFSFENLIAYSDFPKDTLFGTVKDKIVTPKPIKEYTLTYYDQLYKSKI